LLVLSDNSQKSSPCTRHAIVEPIHPKAMPVILTTDEERSLDARAMG
jgi:hypothetical protein